MLVLVVVGGQKWANCQKLPLSSQLEGEMKTRLRAYALVGRRLFNWTPVAGPDSWTVTRRQR